MKNLWITKGTLSSIDQKNKYIYIEIVTEQKML